MGNIAIAHMPSTCLTDQAAFFEDYRDPGCFSLLLDVVHQVVIQEIPKNNYLVHFFRNCLIQKVLAAAGPVDYFFRSFFLQSGWYVAQAVGAND
jgi:hypothetical protein